MERIKASTFLQFWIGVGFLAMLITWFLPWRFQVNDDVIMMWLVSGAYTGEPESYAVYIHPALSWLFSKLYAFSPTVNWYGGTWFLALFLSYLLITYEISCTHFSTSKKRLLVAFILAMILNVCYFLQFTLVAGILAFAGLLVLYNLSGRTARLFQFLGVLAIALSILIRWESFVLLGLGFLLSKLYFKGFTFSKLELRSFLLALLLFLMGYLSKVQYESNSEYQDYLAFNKARTSVIDHPVLYAIIRDDQMLPSPEWFYFSRWMFEDEGISISDLELQRKALNKQRWNFEYLLESFKRLTQILRIELFKSIWILFALILYANYLPKTKKTFGFIASWLLFFLLFNFFFLIFGRVILLFFLVILVPIISESKANKSPLFNYSIMFLWIGFSVLHTFNFLNEARGIKFLNHELNTLLHQIPQGSLVLSEGFYENYHRRKFSHEHTVPILSLGWVSRSPFQEKALNRVKVNSLDAVETYYYIGVNIPEPLVLPDYMESIGGEFEGEDLGITSQFHLKRFTRLE